MVEEITYFCDICNADITNEGIHICKICGREHCKICHETVKGNKDMLMGICSICYYAYDKYKKRMINYQVKYNELYEHDVTKILDEWKKESLLIKNKGDYNGNR